ncbi:MAG TPA: malto-oligosyltrehalose synthase [Polyangiaceae bacterium]|nr:malto-oligosyltrehalose synthase [Polyangiaceae bacterium]
MSLRTPSATYRVQLHAGFGFADAARIVLYLAQLGISDLYLSPILEAAPGSTHGYDVLDHDRLNPELGGEAAFETLCAALKAHRLGLIVDFVPNHMGVGCDGNRAWEDVLEHGQASERAPFFDIDWQPPKETLAHKLLLPILPEQYGLSLERGYFKLLFDGQTLRLEAGKRHLPLRPKSLAPLLTRVADLLEDKADPVQIEALRKIASSFAELEDEVWAHPDAVETYRRNARESQRALSAFVTASNDLRAAFERALAELCGSPSQPESFDFLDELLRAQHYRSSAWQLALEAVNYRRFFDVTELASIRVEAPEVFDASHRKLLALLSDRKITGVRLDHVDGLLDPIGYLRTLAERLHLALPDCEKGELPAYVIVEKILAPGEALPPSFRAHGTTGYEFARAVTGVLLDRRTELSLSNTYRRFTGDTLSFDEHLLRAKRDILDSLLASEATLLSRTLERLAEQDRRWRDLTWHSLHGALVEVMAALDAYRSYVQPDGTRTAEDEALINRAVAAAIRRNPTAGRGAFQFLRSLLLLDSRISGAPEFMLRFQQTTGPVTAKALEDTVFYRYPRNLAENEVGSRPERLGVPLNEFHAHNAAAHSDRPLSLTTTSTHDTKRGEDARARLSMLCELPNTWRQTVFALTRIASRYCSAYEGAEAPARGTQYLYYQSLVGALPFGADADAVLELEPRIQAYMLKACREAKQHSSWLHPDEGYESALRSFIAGTLGDSEFRARLLRFCRRAEPYAACKALAQVTLKLCAPGIPDTYQGSELWHQVLVDPDNRRPVDYGSLQTALEELDQSRLEPVELIRALRESYADGRLKLFVLSRLLRLRAAEPALFRSGYTALDAGENCVAFGRGRTGQACDLLCAVTRFPFRVTRGRCPWPLGQRWGTACVSDEGLLGRYRDVFSGRSLNVRHRLALSELFAELPIAVLVRRVSD